MERGQVAPLSDAVESWNPVDVGNSTVEQWQQQKENNAGPRLSQSDVDQNEINVTGLTVEQTVARIEKCAQNKIGFDIFQLTAFLHNNPSCGSYFFSVVKSMLCLMTQLPAVIYIMYEIIKDGPAEKGDWCNPQKGNNELALGYFAFCLSAFIALILHQLFLDTVHGGMNCVFMAGFTNLPDCISGRWLFVGCFYNTYVYLAVVWASLLVIFFCAKVFDMVLNCVALMFVAQMDEFFVKPADYKMIEKFFGSGYRHTRDNSVDLPYTRAWFCFAYGLWVFTLLISFITMLGVFSSPFVMFICF